MHCLWYCIITHLSCSSLKSLAFAARLPWHWFIAGHRPWCNNDSILKPSLRCMDFVAGYLHLLYKHLWPTTPTGDENLHHIDSHDVFSNPLPPCLNDVLLKPHASLLLPSAAPHFLSPHAPENLERWMFQVDSFFLWSTHLLRISQGNVWTLIWINKPIWISRIVCFGI